MAQLPVRQEKVTRVMGFCVYGMGIVLVIYNLLYQLYWRDRHDYDVPVYVLTLMMVMYIGPAFFTISRLEKRVRLLEEQAERQKSVAPSP